VRNWRLNHAEGVPPCPMCKSAGAFDLELFPADSPEEDEQERQRRAEASRREQELADLSLARELFLDEFGSGLAGRRGAWRRLDLFEIYTFIASSVQDDEGE